MENDIGMDSSYRYGFRYSYRYEGSCTYLPVLKISNMSV